MDAKTDIDPLLECLLVLSTYHGDAVTRESLVSGLPLERSHLTPALFERAALRAGLVTKVLHKPFGRLHHRALPAVLLMEGQEACVLMGFSPDKTLAYVTFPELPDAIEEIPSEQLTTSYSGRVIYARPRFRTQQQSPHTAHSDSYHSSSYQSGSYQSRHQGHWFWSALRANSALYRDVLVAAFFINLFALALPLFAMNVYDRVVPNQALETLWMLASGMAVVLIADLLLRTMRGYFLDLAGKRVDLSLSARLMEQILGLKLAHQPGSVGAFAANVRAYEAVRDFTTSASLTALIDLPFTLVFVLVIGWIAPSMVIPLLVGISVILVVALITQYKMRTLSETLHSASAERNSVLIESLVGLSTLKVLNAEGQMQRRWEQSAAFLDRVAVKLRLLASGNLNVALWAQQLVNVSIIVLGVYLITAGQLTLGGLIAATMLSNRAMAPVGQVAGLLTQYHNARTALNALNDVMAQPVERPADKRFSATDGIAGAVSFQHLSFTYPSRETVALSDINIVIEPGERVAILGRVGSGKTTLSRLLLGLYEPEKGAVLIDSVDLRQLDPAVIREHIGYVAQDVTLFNGSLRDNLMMAAPQATQAELDSAIAFADLSDFVHRHPQGYEMNVGERGEALSGGQRKAVALARAILRSPAVLLLDEVTGSMDHQSEATILRNLKALGRDKTLLFTTHRTAMLELAERIIVLDSGQVVADGPRDKVMDALSKGRIGRAL